MLRLQLTAIACRLPLQPQVLAAMLPTRRPAVFLKRDRPATEYLPVFAWPTRANLSEV